MCRTLMRSLIFASLLMAAITGCNSDKPSQAANKKEKDAPTASQNATPNSNAPTMVRQGNYICTEWQHAAILKEGSGGKRQGDYICIHWVAANMLGKSVQ